jgi:hypothetical protein
VYLLARADATHPDWTAESVVGGRTLGAFVAPPSSKAPTAVVHAPPAELPAGRAFTVTAQVVSADAADSVTLYARRVGAGGPMLRVGMEPAGGFAYRATIPADRVSEGLLEYAVSVSSGGAARTFPDDVAGHPFHWNFTGREFWRVPVVAPEAPVVLFDGTRDLDHVLYPHPWSYVRFRTDVVGGSEPGGLALSAVVEDFTPSPHHFALRTFLTPGERTRLNGIEAAATLRMRARAVGGRAGRLQVSLVTRDGSAWGTVLELTDGWRDFDVPVSELRPTPLALLPRPYPQFLPYLLDPPDTDTLRLAELDGLQFSVSADLFGEADRPGPHGFAIDRVVLERRP